MTLPIDIDQSHELVEEGQILQLNGKSWRVAKIEPGPSWHGYRVAGETGLREALKNAMSALILTVTNVPDDGSRPHWCWGSSDHHDATCSGMLHVQDAGRAALSSEASIVPLRVTAWLEEA